MSIYETDVIKLISQNKGREAVKALRDLKTVTTEYANLIYNNIQPSALMYNRLKQYMHIINYIALDDEFIRGLTHKRITQITAYDFTVEGQPNSMKRKISMSMDAVVGAVVDSSLFGQSLLYINDYGVCEKIPQFLFIRDGKGSFIVDAEKMQGKSFNNDRYIYIQDDSYYTGGIMNTLAPLSISKQHNLFLWWSGNTYLLGSVIAKYNEDFIRILENEEDFSINRTETERREQATQMIYDNLETLADGGKAVVSNNVEFEHKTLANASIGDSVNQYVTNIHNLFEVAILGQAGTTQNNEVGSYAKAEVMNATTADIKFAEMNLTKSVFNEFIFKENLRTKQYENVVNEGFEFVYDDTTTAQDFATLLSTISNTTLQDTDGLNIGINAEDLYARLGLNLIGDKKAIYRFGNGFL